MARTVTTLCLVHEHPKVLLGYKKRGFGVGKWNGFGGKVGEGETIYDAALRELEEEAGVHAEALEEAGFMEFLFADGAEVEVHLFRAQRINGEPTESEEMRPEWFYVDEIPFAQMWPDDMYWFPLFLRGTKFRGRFAFDENEKLTHAQVEPQ